ncbi:MAG: signal peptidase II [Lentisphaerae bacterium]|nr:MAG: signal peptidase II [Lentisphaerota bacterium]
MFEFPRWGGYQRLIGMVILGAVLVVISDQWTKWYIDHKMPIREVHLRDHAGKRLTQIIYVGDPAKGEWNRPIEVIPGFVYIVHVVNRGAAWGIFSGFTWGLALISLIAVGGIVYYMRDICAGYRERWFALSILLGGTIGNLIDRLNLIPRKSNIHGVVDFISLQCRSRGWEWPAFNIADMGISLGVMILVVSFWCRGNPSKQAEKAPAEKQPQASA